MDEAVKNIVFEAHELSELFEQDSRRYSRALGDEQEAKSG